jgi:hypothetical protein
MFGSNSRIKLLLALVALVLFLGMLAVSALTLRTPAPKNTTAVEFSREPSKYAPKNVVVEKKIGRGARGVPHTANNQTTPAPTPAASASPASTGSSGGGDEATVLNTISLVGAIVSTLGTILSVWIAWLTYKQGKLSSKA